MQQSQGRQAAVIRLPEDNEFDITSPEYLTEVYSRYTDFVFTHTAIESLPNVRHDHIKAKDSMRDKLIDRCFVPCIFYTS